MTRSDHRTVDRYISKVLHSTSCPKRARSELRKRLTAQITSFAEGKENITEYMLCMEFGEPEDIADALYNREDYEALLKKSKIQSLILTVLIIIAAIILIFFGYCLFDAIRGALFGVMRISEPYI